MLPKKLQKKFALVAAAVIALVLLNPGGWRPDGALLVSDDAEKLIWRISYSAVTSK